jgi:hypothetical protein
MSASRKWRIIPGFVIHVLVGGIMIFAGSMKVFVSPSKEMLDQMSKMGLAENITIIGTGELVTAVLLILPWTMSLGTLLASSFWGGAICIHMSHGESYALQTALLLLVWIGAVLRRPATLASFARERTPQAT